MNTVVARTGVPADLTVRCLALFTAGMRTADDLTLSHEAERLEALPTSPAVAGMRRIVAVEQHGRRTARRLPDADPAVILRPAPGRRSCAPLEAAA